MKLDRYYYITSLPALGELGSAPPLGYAELMEHLHEDRRRSELVGVLFLLDDLLQREAYLAGELPDVDPAVLTVPQACNESPLPDYLVRDPEPSDGGWGLAADRLWAAYFRYAADVAERLSSRFLADWVAYEVALRNSLATARARRLGLDERNYRIAEELAGVEEVDEMIGQWSAAPNPLAGQQALLRVRWEWLGAHDRWFSFDDDELAVYAARLLLLHQWRRMTAEGGERPAAAAEVA
jgi:hypothetical protein